VPGEVPLTSPMVSVIIPTRNRPEYLRAAFASACAQTLPPAEILVVDDGVGAAESLPPLLAPPRVPFRVLPGRGIGPAAARNVGLRAASGELIAFLDDDDLWHPEKLAWQVEWLTRRPDLGALGTEVVRRPVAESIPEPGRRPRQVHLIGRAALVRANRLTTSSVLARRSCFATCGCFDETLFLAQDWDMWLRLSRRFRIAILPAPLTVYRLHDSQRSNRNTEMRRWEAQVVSRLLEEAPENRWLRGVAHRRLAWAHCRLGRALLRAGEPQQAIAVLRRSLSRYPLHLPAWSALVRCALHHLSPAGAP